VASLTRRRWLAASTSAAALAGCNVRSGDGVTLRFWAMGREGEVVAELLPEFERENPGLRVRVQQQPWTSAHEKLLTAFAGDALPDIAQLGNSWIPEFAALRALQPLDDRVARSAVVRRADYFEGIWQTNTVAGVTYGVPWYVDTKVLFYRNDILRDAGFPAPPTTWDEWRETMRVLKAKRPAAWPIVLPLNEFQPLLVLALQQDDPLLRDGDRYGNFRSAGFRRALAFFDEMYRSGWAPLFSETQIGNVWQEIGRGTFVYYISGPWNIAEFRKRLAPELQDAWSTAPMPGPGGPGMSLAGGASLVIFKHTPHADAAWKLIEFLSRPEQQLKFLALTGDLPPRRTTWAAPVLAADRHARAFRDQLERTKPTPPVPELERIVNEMLHVAERAVRGRIGLDAAVIEMDARVDGFLEKRRWMLARAEARR
jgi:multiple sugar transport system substrate-binding protein